MTKCSRLRGKAQDSLYVLGWFGVVANKPCIYSPATDPFGSFLGNTSIDNLCIGVIAFLMAMSTLGGHHAYITDTGTRIPR